MAVIQLSGQVTVSTAGTAVPCTTAGVSGAGSFYIKALPANTGVIYVGTTGGSDVTSSNGYPLSALDAILVTVTSLSELYVDATVSGEGIAWFRMGGQNIGIDAPAA
ncbi:MAG: hypothetical protein A3J97_11060 [Spirochaetes bacterium RIFOXYC1_FULL_54_7]|nr:MAG: hypothetical protein A3J97_11060 [Spirochaetes bacterium RIFOXYC1_FULL_54_7]